MNPGTGEVKTDFVSFDSNLDLRDYKLLVDCVDGVCKQTAGYINGSDTILSFINNESGVDGYKRSDNGGACSSSAGGKYHDNGGTPPIPLGLCIKDNLPVLFTDDNSVKNTLLYDDVSGTPFEVGKEGDVILVKHGTRYAIIDKFDSGKYSV